MILGFCSIFSFRVVKTDIKQSKIEYGSYGYVLMEFYACFISYKISFHIILFKLFLSNIFMYLNCSQIPLSGPSKPWTKLALKNIFFSQKWLVFQKLKSTRWSQVKNCTRRFMEENFNLISQVSSNFICLWQLIYV